MFDGIDRRFDPFLSDQVCVAAITQVGVVVALRFDPGKGDFLGVK